MKFIIQYSNHNILHYFHAYLSYGSHPHILSIFGGGVRKAASSTAHDALFLVLERLNGGTLMTLLSESKRTPPFRFRHVLEMARSFADAVSYLHERFHPDAVIIHRDLKPVRIMFLCFQEYYIICICPFSLIHVFSSVYLRG